MSVFTCTVLLAAVCHAAPEADPALLYGAHAGLPYAGLYGYPYAAHAVVTGNSVPVAVGGYKADAGSNGDLVGPVHEVPGLIPALAVHKQESSGAVSLSTGTGALVAAHAVHYYGKREADPALLYGAYAGFPYAGVHGYAAGVYGYPYAGVVAPALTYAVKPLELKTAVTATNLAVPVAVGGYKAVAGNNGDLVGAVHEVPGLVPAPALLKNENSNGGSLTVGTSAVVTHSFVKREAEADPALLYGAYAGLPYAGVHGYAAGVYGYPYAGVVAPALTYAVKPLVLKTAVTATNLPVPVAVGGYKAVAGNNGDLVGAVHEVPGLVPAPALLKHENSNGGSLTVGTSAVITHSFVKREAEADPALLYGAYGYGAHGLGYAGYGYTGYPYTYGAYAGYPYYG